MDLSISNSELDLFNNKKMGTLQLPTYLDVYRNFLLNKENNFQNHALKETAKQIIEIWLSTTLPHFSLKSTIEKLKRYFEIIKNLKKGLNRKSFKKNYELHEDKYNCLFDICSCKCLKNCRCQKQDQIPAVELLFITDQRTDRILYILERRKPQDTSYQSKMFEKKFLLEFQEQFDAASSTPYEHPYYKKMIAVAEHYSIPDKVLVELINAYLMDIGRLTATDRRRQISIHLIRTQRKRYLAEKNALTTKSAVGSDSGDAAVNGEGAVNRK